MKRSLQSGFSVIEALAALAIVAIALIPLVSLQGQVARTAAQHQSAHERVTAERNAMALLRDLNIMERPEGALPLGSEFMLRWTAAPASGRPLATTQGTFEVALYDVEARVTRLDGAPVAAFSLEQLGWRAAAQARSP
jgi:general secretion pathway protein I